MPEMLNFAGAAKLYNLTYAVGPNCANKRDDVMLVQWLLKRHFSRPDKKSLLDPAYDVGVLNGTYSEELCDIIKIFQYDQRKTNRAAKYRMDGQIFPIRDVNNPGKYPLVHLNFSVQSYFKKYYEAPKLDPLAWSEFNNMIEKCKS